MRMRTRLSIVTLVGAGALLLLIALAVISAPRAQVAHAQSEYVEVSLLNDTVSPGDYLEGGALFQNMPCQQGVQNGNNQDVCNYLDRFSAGISYRYDLFSGGSDADSCEGQGLGINRTLSGTYYDWKTRGPSPFRIDRDCPTGSYTIKLTVTYSGWSDPLTEHRKFHSR